MIATATQIERHRRTADEAAEALAHLAKHSAFGYDAVDDRSRRRLPTTSSKSEDAELTPSQRGKLNTTARDIHRNFAIAGWMIRRHLDYVSSFSFQSRTGVEGLDERIEELMDWWSRPANCDVAARHGLRRIVRMAEERRTVDGDVFLLKMSDGRVQAIEGDRVRTPTGGLPAGVERSELTHGVQTGRHGAARAYAVCKRRKLGGFEFERILRAAFCEHHAYFTRFDQVRGVSPLTPAINTLRDTYEGFDYALAKAKVAQLFGLIFYRDAAEPVAPVTGADADEDGVADSGYKVDFGKSPVILDLDPGDKAEFLENRTPSTEFGAFTQTMIAVGLKCLDIPYSFYDEAHTNFYGSRGGLIQYLKACTSKREDNRGLLERLTRWRQRLWVDDGELVLPAGMAVRDLKSEWVHDGVPWWDPMKEVRGHRAAVASGFSTPQRVCREGGTDFYENVDRLAEAVAYAKGKLDPLGIALNFGDVGPTTEIVNGKA